MKVLMACEESQTVCKAFRAKGHEAYSCDLLACSGGHPEWHIQDDVRNHLKGWDMILAFPPCTRLTNSGVRWLEPRNLWDELSEAIEFFNCFKGQAKYVAIENPVPHKYAVYGFDESKKIYPEIQGIGKYDQKVQPWMFGHGETKGTCFWLENLPPLQATNIVEGREPKVHFMAPSEDRAKLRSKTYEGIAQAMADQWGSNLQMTLF